MKSDFEKNLAILKRLEARAKQTGNEMDKFMAERMRVNMMSYKRMTRQLLAFASSKSKEFRHQVLQAVDRKDVEKIYRLWVKYCKEK